MFAVALPDGRTQPRRADRIERPQLGGQTIR